jgi:ABC-type transporter Mla subunit MlaD
MDKSSLFSIFHQKPWYPHPGLTSGVLFDLCWDFVLAVITEENTRDMPDADDAFKMAAEQLSDSVDALAGHAIDLRDQRTKYIDLADHYEDFAGRMSEQYPSLAGPATALADLFRQLDASLGRLESCTDGVIAHGGTLADQVTSASRRDADPN